MSRPPPPPLHSQLNGNVNDRVAHQQPPRSSTPTRSGPSSAAAPRSVQQQPRSATAVETNQRRPHQPHPSHAPLQQPAPSQPQRQNRASHAHSVAQPPHQHLQHAHSRRLDQVQPRANSHAINEVRCDEVVQIPIHTHFSHPLSATQPHTRPTRQHRANRPSVNGHSRSHNNELDDDEDQQLLLPHSTHNNDEFIDSDDCDTERVNSRQNSKYDRHHKSHYATHYESLLFDWPTWNELFSLSYYRSLSPSTSLTLMLMIVFALLFLSSHLSSYYHSNSSSHNDRLLRAHYAAHDSECADDPVLCLSHQSHGAHAMSDLAIYNPHTANHSHSDSDSDRPHYSVHDVTIFTTYTPDPVLASSHSLHLHALYSWRLRIPHATHTLVFVSDRQHCAAFDSLPVAQSVTCRVTAKCFDLLSKLPYLACILTEAKQRSLTALLIYLEDHLIVFNDFVPALLKIANTFSGNFFMSGATRALTLTMDNEMDLVSWQRDIESAYHYDSSSESLLIDQQNEKRKEKLREKNLLADDDESSGSDNENSIHYFAYHRDNLPITDLPARLTMGSEQENHQWEKHLLSTLLLRDTITIIDASASILAIELTHHSDHSNLSSHAALHSHSRADTDEDINDVLTFNVTGLPLMQLGKLANSHYTLTGKCPTCSLKENREADLPLILIRHANEYKQIIIVAVNYEYLSLAFNWICRVRALNIHNFILLAEDRVSYRILRKMNIPVVLRKDAPYKKLAATAGSRAFQETLYLRAIFFHQVVMLGFDLLLSHLDTVWFQSPLPDFHRDECDMHVSLEHGMTGMKAGGGLLSIKSNKLGRLFVNEYLQCEHENYLFITMHGRGRFTYSDDPDIDCVELISSRMQRRNKMKRCILDPMSYVDEKQFFCAMTPQKRAMTPVMAHLDATEGVKNKTKIFIDWDLWSVDDSAMNEIPILSTTADHPKHAIIQCKKPQRLVPKPVIDRTEHRTRIIVNILASTEPFGLNETLRYLALAQYQPRVPIDLHITIQQPEHDTQSAAKKHIETTRVAKEFHWIHGEKRVIYLDSFVGVSAAWLNSWTVNIRDKHRGHSHITSGDEEFESESIFQLALTAGLIVSHDWFMWVESALNEYYFHPFHHVPQLMGFTLTHTIQILGETPSQRYGSHEPSKYLTYNQSLYYYQYIPFLGTLFFPHHFLSFLQWYHRQDSDSHSNACVPTLISNQWWMQDAVHTKYWTQWLLRFAFESGWFTLHTNFLQRVNDSGSSLQSYHPRALIIDSSPVSSDTVTLLIKKVSKREKALLPLSHIKLYDFHFRHFTDHHSLLALRQQLFPPVSHLHSEKHRERAEMLEQQRLKQRVSEDDHSGHSHAVAADHHNGGGDSEEGVWAAIERLESSNEIVVIGEQFSDGHIHAESHALTQTQHSDSEEDSMMSDEERGVTATELIIQMMITAMEQEGANDPTMIDADALTDSHSHSHGVVSDAYHSQLQALKHKVSAALLGLAHSHSQSLFRHHNVSRCFTMNDLSDTVVSVDQRLHMRYNVSDYDLHDMYKNLYTKIHANLVQQFREFEAAGASETERYFTQDIRFLIYSPQKLLPFDGHLRGIYFAFLVALLTDRILLIDLPEFHSHYHSPWGASVSWNIRDFLPYFHNQLGVKFNGQDINYQGVNDRLRTDDFNSLHANTQLLYHRTGVTYDRLLFMNKQYAAFLPALFGSNSRMRRTGQTMRFLLSDATREIRSQASLLFQSFDLQQYKYSVVVNIVSNDPKQFTVSAKHYECIRSLISALHWQRHDVAILVSGNGGTTMINTLTRLLEPYGTVKHDPRVISRQSNGQCNASVSASKSASEIDPYVLHHYLFGEFDVSISSGTTYGIFGAARTGYSKRAYLYKAAPPPAKDKDGRLKPSTESEYCGPMHRIDLPNENDINF